jgi:hypothetical protein
MFCYVRTLIAAVFFLTGLTQYGLAQTAVDTATYADGVKFLDQNWSHDERLEYYYTSQGSAALRYGIFVAVEQVDTQDLFRSDLNLARFGFITQPADPKYNPDVLPVGIAMATVPDGRWKGEWAGLTCAACRNGQIAFKGAKIRITGGNNGKLHFYAFLEGLDDALHATLSDPAGWEHQAGMVSGRSRSINGGHCGAPPWVRNPPCLRR